MRSDYLRNGKPYDDGHTRKSWSYWFMEMVRRRRAPMGDPALVWDAEVLREWADTEAVWTPNKPMRGGKSPLFYVDDAADFDAVTFKRVWGEINAMIDASPTTAGGLVIVDDAGDVTEDHWRVTRHD